MALTPARAVWSQKISRQEAKVTMIPPMNGPNAGPTYKMWSPISKLLSSMIASTSYQSPTEEETVCRSPLDWPVDVSDDCGAYYEKAGALESSKHSKTAGVSMRLV